MDWVEQMCARQNAALHKGLGLVLGQGDSQFDQGPARCAVCRCSWLLQIMAVWGTDAEKLARCASKRKWRAMYGPLAGYRALLQTLLPLQPCTSMRRGVSLPAHSSRHSCQCCAHLVLVLVTSCVCTCASGPVHLWHITIGHRSSGNRRN